MKIHVDVKGPEVFTPCNPVKGVVRLKLLRSTVVKDLIISLQGSVRTSLVEPGPAFILGNDAPTVAEEVHELFKLSKGLSPQGNMRLTPREYTLPAGEHYFPFEISFPSDPQYEPSHPGLEGNETVLPPSYQAHAAEHGAAAKVEYILKVDVNRPGQLRTTRSTSTQRKLTFLSPDPDPYSMPSLRLPYYGRQGVLYTSSQAPHLIVEGRLPSPVLFPGEKLPLHLFVWGLPTRFESFSQVRLRSLSITLQSTTLITAGTHRTSWTTFRNLHEFTNLKGIISGAQDNGPLSEINESIYRNVVIPKVAPSFTTCTIEQKYALGVDVGLSVGEMTNLKPVNIVLNVQIWSGIGNRRAYPAIPSGPTWSEGIPSAVPLSPGYLAHLGAFGPDAEDGPPPYY
ncbi:hypothetical protein BJX76DRAFT_358794 [Aspergillus varians]